LNRFAKKVVGGVRNLNEKFQWCETQRDCNRLRLIDILVRPMQRLTKYSLLLKAVLKKTDDINVKKDLVEMDKNVESLVRDVNSHMRQRQEQERLKNIIARIDSYEPIETKDDELQGLLATSSHLDLTCPMPGCAPGQRRHLLMEGDLKMREGSSSKIDVHCFLFTDMLLVCKTISKKGERVKVIRQPYIVDRLVTVDVTRDSSTCLACVYLNEYKIAVAAFTLHGSENKLVRSWKDSLEKANTLYQEAKMATVCSLENILFTNYDEEEEEFSGGSYLHAPISRRGSRRSSRYSSIAHSHSGSMDLNDASVASGKRDVSLELSDGRGSSFSSEDSCTPILSKPRAASLDNRLLDTSGGQGSYPSSPRNERKLTPHKLSPNTLSVEITPDDTDRDTSSHGPPRVHSPLSPIRGISYPPLSPKSLKRGFAIQQQMTRNPPLIKSRQLAASAEIAPGRAGETLGPNITVIADQPPDPDTEQEQRQKRGGRFDRPDTRRYHTAGTIEDLKKADTKDSSIHKRLSWNQQPTIPGNDLQLKTKQSKCLSTDSVQSSSGVSSNGSLHLSIGSEFEPLAPGPPPSSALLGSSVVTIGGLSVPASPLPNRTQPANTPPIPPRGHHHISTTYITQDTVIVRQASPSAGSSTHRTHHGAESHAVKNSTKSFPGKGEGQSKQSADPGGHPHTEKAFFGTLDRLGARKTAEPTNPEITINLAEAKETISPININISNQKSPNSEILKLREILLSDSSVEASNV
jgi:pleckstrin domain-containing family G protein 5